MGLAEGPQRSDAGEALTRGPSVSMFHLFLIYFSSNMDRDKADSEQMAVRTAEKLLKVSCNIIYRLTKMVFSSEEKYPYL